MWATKGVQNDVEYQLVGKTDKIDVGIPWSDGLLKYCFFLKMAILGLFFIYFRFFKQTSQILQQIKVKNVHPVCGAGIRTKDLQNTSLLT